MLLFTVSNCVPVTDSLYVVITQCHQVIGPNCNKARKPNLHIPSGEITYSVGRNIKVRPTNFLELGPLWSYLKMRTVNAVFFILRFP